MKAVKDERDEAEQVEMDGAGCIPAANEDEEADEKVEQGGDSKVVFERGGILLRCGDERNFKRLTVAQNAVAQLHPRASAVEHLGDVSGAVNRDPAHGLDGIALLDARAIGRSA